MTDCISSDLLKLCKHISSEHSYLFPKRDGMENKCDMCYIELFTNKEVTAHMQEKNSPETFYEKTIADISGECRYCKNEIPYSEMENHFNDSHNKIQNNLVLEIL